MNTKQASPMAQCHVRQEGHRLQAGVADEPGYSSATLETFVK